MANKNKQDIKKLSFEESLSQLENIVTTLENGEVGLDEAMEAYVKGQELKDHCIGKLNQARLKIEQINTKADGSIGLEPILAND